MNQAPFVFMGGTFDPIHHGHLRTALELQQWIGCPSVCLIPSGQPVHRGATVVSAQQRLAMVELAVADEPALQVDAREVNTAEPSFSIHTLRSLRAELGDARPLCMVMGMDAYLGLAKWREWDTFLALCHIIVVARPGYSQSLPAELVAFTRKHQSEHLDELLNAAAGQVLVHELTPLGISATQIRTLIAAGQSPRYLLPDPVWHYIQQHQLYGCN